MNNTENDESNLKLLIDSCQKTLATAMGNGHHEYVLYRNTETGDYELHYYDLPVGSQSEFHSSKITSEAVYLELMKLIEDKKLIEHKDVRGIGLCGGDYICKFRKDDELIRITTANYNGEGFKAIIEVYQAMAGYFASASANE